MQAMIIRVFLSMVFVASCLGVWDMRANAADYFPLAVGNCWVYRPSYGNSGDRIDSIIGSETVNGVRTYIWNRKEAPDDNYDEKRWIAKDASGLKVYKIWGNEGPISQAVTLDPPWVMLKFEPKKDDTWIFEMDVDNVHFKVTYSIEAIDDVITVPAGSFNNCIRLRQLDETTIDGTTEYGYYRYWYAPNVGPIRYTKYSADLQTIHLNQELVSNPVTIRESQLDINGDGILGLEDVIWGLQVLSGRR